MGAISTHQHHVLLLLLNIIQATAKVYKSAYTYFLCLAQIVFTNGSKRKRFNNMIENSVKSKTNKTILLGYYTKAVGYMDVNILLQYNTYVVTISKKKSEKSQPTYVPVSIPFIIILYGSYIIYATWEFTLARDNKSRRN